MAQGFGILGLRGVRCHYRMEGVRITATFGPHTHMMLLAGVRTCGIDLSACRPFIVEMPVFQPVDQLFLSLRSPEQ